jgi:Predicted P-loop-containing kinase
MLSALRERIATGQRVAVVVDTRANEPLEDAEQTVLQMRADGAPIEVLFLDCADEVLVRRFKETRRPHPLASREPSLPRAIRAERALLAPLRAIADHTLDTTLFKPQDLREAIRQRYADEKAQPPLRVRIVSFGFKYGVPADADLVFDVRFLRNPHYVPRLKPKPGTDPAVRAYVLGDSETQEFLETVRNFLAYLLPRYEREGKAYLTVGIGCTGGRHRSVVLSEALQQWFIEQGYRATVEHRDLTREEA